MRSNPQIAMSSKNIYFIALSSVKMSFRIFEEEDTR